MNRTALVLALLALTGCTTSGAVRADHAGFFDSPTASDLAAERDACYRSTFCRHMTGQSPPALYVGLNDRRDAVEHAYEAERRLEGVAGVQRMQLLVGDRRSNRAGHANAVLLVTYEGHDYVIEQERPARIERFRSDSCQTSAECALDRLSAGEPTTCPDGVCDARDGLHDLVVSGAPIPMWPKQDYIAAKSADER